MPLRADAAEKRQHIIETAYRLFKRDGFHATGIDKIIAEAAVAKMTMYRHFPSKDGLIVEVLQWRADRFKRQLDRLSETTMTPHEKIAAIFDWHERWFDSADFHGCLFQHALAEFGKPAHAVFESVVRQKGDLQERIRDILAQSLPYDRAEDVATTLFMLIEAATVLAHMGQGKAANRQRPKGGGRCSGIGRTASMSAIVISLALFAAILHATWNAFLRGGGGRLWTVTVMSFASTVFALPFVFIYPLPASGAWLYIVFSAVL